MVKFVSNKNSQLAKNTPYNNTDWSNWISKTAYGVTISVTYMLICCTGYYWIIEYHKKFYGYCRCNMSISWFICFSNVHMIYIGSSIVGWYRNAQAHIPIRKCIAKPWLNTWKPIQRTSNFDMNNRFRIQYIRPLNINLIKLLIFHDLHNTGLCSCFPTICWHILIKMILFLFKCETFI